MLNMDINQLISAKGALTKSLYSAVIVLASILIPFFLTPEGFWDKFILNYKTITFLLLYSVVVLGFILLVFDIRSFNVTTEETDKKINHYRNMVRIKLNKYWWVFAAIFISLFAIMLWGIFKNA